MSDELPIHDETQEWTLAFQEAETLDDFNALVGLIKERRDADIIGAMVREARNRGYVANKEKGIYQMPGPNMERTKGKNLLKVGWMAGDLYCEFGEGRRYRFKRVPETECGKLIRSLYPDALFVRNIKGRFESEKIA